MMSCQGAGPGRELGVQGQDWDPGVPGAGQGRGPGVQGQHPWIEASGYRAGTPESRFQAKTRCSRCEAGIMTWGAGLGSGIGTRAARLESGVGVQG